MKNRVGMDMPKFIAKEAALAAVIATQVLSKDHFILKNGCRLGFYLQKNRVFGNPIGVLPEMENAAELRAVRERLRLSRLRI